MTKVRFILDGGFSEVAEANTKFFGMKWKGRVIKETYARFESGQCAYIKQEDEGKVWEVVK